jgi:hypothetical protein
MDWLYKLSIYISIPWGYNPSKTESVDAEVTAFIDQLVQNLALYIPIHL